MKGDIDVTNRSISSTDTIMTTMADKAKRATEIGTEITANIDITEGSLLSWMKIEKRPNFKAGKIPAQSRRRLLQLLPIETARVIQDALECL